MAFPWVWPSFIESRWRRAGADGGPMSFQDLVKLIHYHPGP